MKKRCSTCPFGEKGQKDNCPEIADTVRARALTVSQVCHHPRLNGKKETHLCRGGRDYQLEIMHRLRVITEPTDEAWNMARTQNLKFLTIRE